MARLFVHVEGETEEDFVNEVLGPYLVSRGYSSVSARILGNTRQRDRRGGIRPWTSAKQDIVRHLLQNRGCIATTMIDYYGLPRTGNRAWPGRAEASTMAPNQKAVAVESAVAAEIAARMGWSVAHDNRFVPFVVMHEFEGLLFSNCAAFARAIGRPWLANAFQGIRDQFTTPEDINDSPVTAPSKRVEQLVAGYQKPIFGNLAALETGLDAIRNECPHFNDWLVALEERA